MEDGRPFGIGSVGFLPEEMTVREAAEYVKRVFQLPFVTVYGDDGGSRLVKKRLSAQEREAVLWKTLWRRAPRCILPEIWATIQESTRQLREWR